MGMKQGFIVFVSLLAGLVFSVSASKAATVTVDDTLKNLIGRWKGEAFVEKRLDRTEELVLRPIFDNKFVFAELAPLPGQTKNFQGKGFLSYDSNEGKYLFYWFDNDGFNGKYEGEKQANSIIFAYVDRRGNKRILTLEVENKNQFTVSIQDGGRLVQTIKYTRE